MKIEQEIRQALDRLSEQEQKLLKDKLMWDVDIELTSIQTRIDTLKWILYGSG